jgi:hypothetical protein
LLPLCTVGAAELAPPASGSTALFPTTIELAAFSSPWPVAAGDVVQAVSDLLLDAAVDWSPFSHSTLLRRSLSATRMILSPMEWEWLAQRKTFCFHNGSWDIPCGVASDVCEAVC